MLGGLIEEIAVEDEIMGTAGQDPVLDFLICWYLATAGEGRHHVMAALRRRATTTESLDAEGGPRLWSWCTSMWLPGWLRAAGMPEEARAVERGGSAMLSEARHAARKAATHHAGSTSPVCAILERMRAYAAVEASGAAAVTCSGVAGDQTSATLAAARDTAYVALQRGADIGRVVARSRHTALALVADITGAERQRVRGAAAGADPFAGGPRVDDVVTE